MKFFKLLPLLTISLVSTLFVCMIPASQAEGHLITVSSDALPYTCYLDTITADGAATGLAYTIGPKAPINFTVAALQDGSTLYKKAGQKVVQVKLDKNFDTIHGGDAQMIMLHDFKALGANDLRILHLRVSNDNGNWTAYVNENGLLAPFDTFQVTSSQWGINTVHLKLADADVATYDIGKDLDQQ